MQHYIFTRWNLSDTGMSVYDTDKTFAAYKVRIDAEKWMQERIVLFEKYCLPSILRQTNKNFTWLLAFDKKTPEYVYKKYEQYPFVKIIFEFPAVYLRNLYGTAIKDNDIIITTRLDNDDCVAPTFIEEIQKRNEGITKLVDSWGCQYDSINDKWYMLKRPYTNSAFLSVIEKVGEDKDMPIKTCYYKPHQNMHLNFTNEWINEILYCQILHWNNLGNKIDGAENDIENIFFNNLNDEKITTIKEEMKGWVSRMEIINYLIQKNNYKRYLEIGVRDGDCFKEINIDHKDGVDVAVSSYTNYLMTSDRFFNELAEDVFYDIIFIDGLHTAEQVYKDIINSFRHLSDNGVIICHDMNPPFEEYQTEVPMMSVWNGNGWRAFVQLRIERNDLEMFTINTDWGLGIIRKGTQQKINIDKLTFNYFDKNRKYLLNLISIDEFYKLKF